MAKSISRYLADISSTSGVLDGTLSTAAQANITSLGTLSSLTVSGSAAMTLTTAAQPNITSVGTLSSLTVSGAMNGTLSTAAQPNITSVGTLSSLTVSGNTNATLTTAAQPNITSVGTLTALTVDNIAINGSEITGTGDTKFLATGDIGIGPRQGTAANGAVYIGGNTDNPFVSPVAFFHGEGRVGVNSNSPLTPLHIAGNSTNAFLISPAYQSIGNNLYYNGSAWDAYNHSAAGGVFQIGAGTFALRRSTAADPPVVSYTMYADADGKVGINTTSPVQKLTVAGNISVTAGQGYMFGNGSCQIYSDQSYIRFRTSSLDRMEIFNNGNISIDESLSVGTDTAYDKLTVLRTSTSQTAGMTLVNLQNGGYGSGITWECKRSDANNVQTAARLYVAGASSWNSDSTASSQFIFFLRSANTLTERLRISHDGTFTGSGSNDISDQRLKENIKTIPNALTTIKGLTGRTFTWKEKAKQPPGTKYGFLAQEVQSVVSDLVNNQVGILKIKEDESVIYEDLDAAKEGEWAKSVQTTGIIPILVEAIKELAAKVEALESK